MKAVKTIETIIYETTTKKKPFIEWQEKLTKKVESIVLVRLARMRSGNFGDHKPVKRGNGIYELRIDFGPGYRIYFGKQGATLVILLAGGDKGSQDRDIEKAKQYWSDFKERKDGKK